MPTNLPPQYFEAEKKLRTATTSEEKKTILEELLSIVPKHKGTDKLRAMLRTKIAKLKSTAQKKQATSKHGPTYNIKKSGAGQVVIIGPPNAGKSMMVKSLTNAAPVISNYPFSTHAPYPAMMEYKDIQIQLIDTPPITPDYIDVWHPELIKAADAILLLIDLSSSNPTEILASILNKLKEKNIEFVEAADNPTSDRTISFNKVLVIANKNDLPVAGENLNTLKKTLPVSFKWMSISAQTGDGLSNLKEKIFFLLDIIRVYSKIPGKKTELNEPYTLKKGSTVTDMAKAVHGDFTQKLKFARIWSKNKYQGQKVNRDYVLEDEDIIELHI